MELSWEELKNTVNFKCFRGNFEEIKKEIEEDDFNASSLSNFEFKQEIMFRLLEENLDLGKYKEEEWELFKGNGIEHSKRMEIRCNIIEDISKLWVEGKLKNLEEAQIEVNKIINSQKY